MSQQGFTIVSLQAEGIDVGDLEFIEGKVVAGDYFQVSGDINAMSDTIEFIVPNGKTAFLVEAKIVMTGIVTLPTSTGNNQTVDVKNEVQAELKVDTVTKDTAHVGINARSRVSGGVANSSSHTYGNTGDGRFNVLGLSLVGDGIKKIEIENTVDAGTAFATMSGYLIDT